MDKRTSKNHAAEPIMLSDAASLPLTSLLHNLHSSENGLSTSDATDILKRIGSNRIEYRIGPKIEMKSVLLYSFR